MPEPVTLADAKLAARLDADDTTLDSFVTGAISAAREGAERITGRSYLQRAQLVELTDWPSADQVLPHYQPSACAVSYFDTTGSWVTLATDQYELGALRNGTILAPTFAAAAWPVLGQRTVGPRVRITLTAGPADPADVPAAVKLYIKANVAAWVDNPAAMAAGSLQVSPLFERLLDRERLYL